MVTSRINSTCTCDDCKRTPNRPVRKIKVSTFDIVTVPRCNCHDCKAWDRLDIHPCNTCGGPEGIPHRDSCPCCFEEPQWDIVRRLLKDAETLRRALPLR